jgi:hypothetical protein
MEWFTLKNTRTPWCDAMNCEPLQGNADESYFWLAIQESMRSLSTSSGKAPESST